MKTIKYLILLSMLGFAFASCLKNNDIDFPQYDHSLIMSNGSGTKLMLTNPVNGKDLFMSKPSPVVEDVKSLRAGYMCKNAVFVAKTYLSDDYIMSIYTCDAKTGVGTKAITGDNLYVQDVNTSKTEPKIVFTGKPKAIPEYNSLYIINEDGSNQSHLTLPLEGVTGLDGKEYELLDISSPAFSPDGSKIAVNAIVDNLYSIPNSIFFEGILLMNNDGSNKKFLYWKQGKFPYANQDICWSEDGNFLLFVTIDIDNSFHRQINAINITSKKITNLTASLEINGNQVNDIYTSPNSNKIVFNQYLDGGSDLFIADYEVLDDIFSIKKSPIKLTDRNNSEYSYYTPSWQLWDENL